MHEDSKLPKDSHSPPTWPRTPSDNFHFCCLVIISARKVRNGKEKPASERKIIFNSIDNQQKQKNQRAMKTSCLGCPNNEFNFTGKTFLAEREEIREQRAMEIWKKKSFRRWNNERGFFWRCSSQQQDSMERSQIEALVVQSSPSWLNSNQD